MAAHLDEVRSGGGEDSAALGPLDAGLAGVAIGATFGFLEGARHFIFRFLLDRPSFSGILSPDTLWMTPLAGAVAVALFGVSIWVLLRLVRPSELRGPWILWPLLALGIFMTAWSVLEAVAFWASAVLAVGAAFQITHWIHARRGRGLSRSIRRAGVAALTLWLVAFAGAKAHERTRRASSVGEASSAAPNVLLIILDTVRAANMSLYGHPRPTTPNLERWARRGTVFELAIAPSSWTLPSHATLFTGRHASELAVDWLSPLDGEFPTLAEWFGSHGYATGGFVANLEVTGEQFGLDRGFQQFDSVPVSWRAMAASLKLTREAARLVRRLTGDERRYLVRKDAARVSREFLDWKVGVGGRPFFAFLNYFDAHDPYVVPSDWERRVSSSGDRFWFTWDRPMTPEEIAALSRSYDESIRYLDHQLDLLLTALDRDGSLSNTIVVITSDHGEEFYEHGSLEHGKTLYVESTHVPLIVLAPSSDFPAGRVAPAVGLRDIPATVVELAGLGQASPFPGSPLSPKGGDPEGAFSMLTARPRSNAIPEGGLQAVQARGHHYIRSRQFDLLFDLATDPRETADLSGNPENADLIRTLRQALDRTFERRAGNPAPSSEARPRVVGHGGERLRRIAGGRTLAWPDEMLTPIRNRPFQRGGEPK